MEGMSRRDFLKKSALAGATVLSGTGSIEHLEDNVRAIDTEPLPTEVSERLRELFLPVARNVGHGMRG